MKYKAGDIVDIKYDTLNTVGTVLSVVKWSGSNTVCRIKLLKEHHSYDRAAHYISKENGGVHLDEYYFSPVYLSYNTELNRNKHIDSIVNE